MKNIVPKFLKIRRKKSGIRFVDFKRNSARFIVDGNRMFVTKGKSGTFIVKDGWNKVILVVKNRPQMEYLEGVKNIRDVRFKNAVKLGKWLLSNGKQLKRW